jgi:TetR/AcrR family transcriptional regulator, regulator of biofilm formation and stress response
MGSGEPVTRYSKGEARMQEILNATIDLIYEEGVAAVSHRAVARRANVTASAPSYFFPSIDDLIVQAFRSVTNEMVRSIESLTARMIDQHMSREEAIDAYVHMLVNTPPKWDELQYEAYLFASRRSALRPEVDEVLAMTHRAFAALTRAAGREDLEWAAPIFSALADGFGLYRVTDPNGTGFAGIKDGILALLESLPGRGRDGLVQDPSGVSPKRLAERRPSSPRTAAATARKRPTTRTTSRNPRSATKE